MDFYSVVTSQPSLDAPELQLKSTKVFCNQAKLCRALMHDRLVAYSMNKTIKSNKLPSPGSSCQLGK